MCYLLPKCADCGNPCYQVFMRQKKKDKKEEPICKRCFIKQTQNKKK